MYIIIGASSFIGAYTAEEFLKHGCRVLATGRNDRAGKYFEASGAEYLNLDLTCGEDFEQLPKSGVEGVILLAGLLPANAKADLVNDENAADYFKVNTIGTINVLEYCRRNGIGKLLAASSYADVASSWGTDRKIPDDEPRGYGHRGDHAVYVFSKNAANDVIEYYNQQHGMNNAVFRLPPVYGVGPHGSLFVNGKRVRSGLQTFIDKASAGEEITVFGDREISRDVVYVKDVARAFYLAALSDNAKGLYNISSGRGVTLAEQAEIIAEIFSPCPEIKSKVVRRPEVSSGSSSFLFSIEKAEKDFGYVPEYGDFRIMMRDYKNDLENHKFRDLFRY